MIEFAKYPSELTPGRKVFALGVFDGVHLGHQEIFRELCALAERTDSTPVALFFEPHPKSVLFPPGPDSLTSGELRRELIHRCGVREIIEYPFTRELAGLSPEEFLDAAFISDRIQTMGFCVGDNWRFGRKNSGTPDLLAAWGKMHGAETVVVASVSYGDDVISSTRIRQAVLDGKLDDAAEMLGRPYGIAGEIQHGWRNGHSVTRYPTANLDQRAGLFPPRGVYASRVVIDGITHPGITYVGDAPTIRKDVKCLLTEIHLLDNPKEELYGKSAYVEYLKLIRSEREFENADALREQIARDIVSAKEILG